MPIKGSKAALRKWAWCGRDLGGNVEGPSQHRCPADDALAYWLTVAAGSLWMTSISRPSCRRRSYGTAMACGRRVAAPQRAAALGASAMVRRTQRASRRPCIGCTPWCATMDRWKEGTTLPMSGKRLQCAACVGSDTEVKDVMCWCRVWPTVAAVEDTLSFYSQQRWNQTRLDCCGTLVCMLLVDSNMTCQLGDNLLAGARGAGICVTTPG